jgi:hypothetical protein
MFGLSGENAKLLSRGWWIGLNLTSFFDPQLQVSFSLHIPTRLRLHLANPAILAAVIHSALAFHWFQVAESY